MIQDQSSTISQQLQRISIPQELLFLESRPREVHCEIEVLDLGLNLEENLHHQLIRMTSKNNYLNTKEQ